MQGYTKKEVIMEGYTNDTFILHIIFAYKMNKSRTIT